MPGAAGTALALRSHRKWFAAMGGLVQLITTAHGRPIDITVGESCMTYGLHTSDRESDNHRMCERPRSQPTSHKSGWCVAEEVMTRRWENEWTSTMS